MFRADKVGHADGGAEVLSEERIARHDSPLGWKVFESCELSPLASSLLMSNWFSRLILRNGRSGENDLADETGDEAEDSDEGEGEANGIGLKNGESG